LAYGLVILSTVACAAIGHEAIGRSVDRVAATSAVLDATHAQLGGANAILGYAVGFRQSAAGGTSTQVMLGMRDALARFQSLRDSPQPEQIGLTPEDATHLLERQQQADSAYADFVAASSGLVALSVPGSQSSQIDAAVDRVASTEATYSDALQNVQAIYEQAAARVTGELRTEELALAVTIIALILVEIVVLIAPAHRNAARILERSVRSEEQNLRIGSEVARHVADRERKEAETQFHTLFRNAAIGVALADSRGRILDTNPTLQRILGYSASELHGSQFGEWADPSTHSSGLASDCERIYIRKDGEKIWVEERLSQAFAPNGEVLISVGMVHDISARKEAERRLRHDATYDGLTGLSNRKVFQRATERAYRRAAASSADGFALLMIDLDRFKFVNDSRGHRFGDAVLAEVGRRIGTWARPNDVVARFGGDEFTALLRGITEPGVALQMADQLQAVLSAPIAIGDVTIRTTASIGVCLWSPALESAEGMLQAADAAAYRAKAHGRARAVAYDADMAAGERIRNRIGTELRFALERQQLRVVYQPVFELLLRRCTGFEALVRWSHPELGSVSPATFIPVAEESGLIAPIGTFVLREAGRTLAELRKQFPNCTMNVNVSAQQFVDPKFPAELNAMLGETGLTGAAFGLEITETTMLDGERLAADVLESIRNTGARLVLDDFGTGYSSFAYLQSLPINALKIDQRFVSGRDGRLASPPIVRALLALSESMRIDVVAEGVETEQQARELSAMGCRYVQGFLLSTPLEGDDALALITPEIEARTAST
jgi:diguanylate cyclase (GGDEF)-like protein/PAS domain S-box-containing protein